LAIFQIKDLPKINKNALSLSEVEKAHRQRRIASLIGVEGGKGPGCIGCLN